MDSKEHEPLPMAGVTGRAGIPIQQRPPITVDVTRGPLLESRHVVYGVVLRSDPQRTQDGPDGATGEAWGDASFLTVARSALKPWQVLPLVVDGGADAFSLNDEELALAAGSHSSRQEHLRVLGGFMRKAGVEESELACPGHVPFDPEAARLVGTQWGRRHDNCSGKHIAMVAWCRHAGLDATGYASREHPVQERVIDLVARLAGEHRNALGVAVDGCRLPTVGLKLASLARLFLLLGRPSLLTARGGGGGEDARVVADGLARVADAMAANPFMVAGDTRVDTEVIAATKGRVVTKAGAEGVWGGVDRDKGVAFAFKAVDGASRGVVPAVLKVLEGADVLGPDELEVLSRHAQPVVRDRADDKVGRVVVGLPALS